MSGIRGNLVGHEQLYFAGCEWATSVPGLDSCSSGSQQNWV